MLVNRRKLIQIAALGSAAYFTQACSKKSDPVPNVSGELGADKAADKPATELISESDGTASALGYKHDASTVPASEKVEKNGTPGSQQTCFNCVFYTADGSDRGKCALLPAGLVAAKGWCKSWSLKQG